MLLSITIRLLLALVCGGILGFERERRKQPAGFRTYMLVCVSSALVMMTNQFLAAKYPGIDPSRMGAQVISGIGFLGAGTIIVTGRNRVRGLTTAAGLWAASCIGLAVGIEFYSGAIIGCLLILLVMEVFTKLDEYLIKTSKITSIYVEFKESKDVGRFIASLKERGCKLNDFELFHENSDCSVSGVFTMTMTKRDMKTEVIAELNSIPGVRHIEEV